jgi:hypothetical protein
MINTGFFTLEYDIVLAIVLVRRGRDVQWITP